MELRIGLLRLFLQAVSTLIMLTKLLKYRTAGVREYWIVNPLKDTIQTYSFEGEENSVQYAFDEIIPVTIYSDFKICIADLLK